MRKWGIATLAALLMCIGGVAYAEDRPTSPPDAPGTEPAIEPIEPTTIEVESVTFSVDGKVVDVLPVEKAVKALLTLRNNQRRAVTNVRVRADVFPSQGMRFTEAEAAVGDIAVGATQTATLELIIAKGDDCQDNGGFGGEITHDGGSEAFKVGFRVVCPGPRIYLQDVIYSGGDGDDVPEPGETIRVTIVLRNEGRDAATGVRGKVTITSDKVSTQDSDLAWPDIDPGDSARSVSPLTIVIEDDAPRQEGTCDDVKTLPAPVEDQGSLPPDTAVSSDGTVSSPAAAASDLPASSEPGSAGEGAPGSTGSGTPTVVEPTTGTIEPEPSVEPVPEPGTIEPQPEPADKPAVVALDVALTASDYKTSFGFSNRIFCTMEGRAVTDGKRDLAAAQTAADDASGTSGGTATPLVVAALVSAAAIGGRRFLILR